MLSLPGYFITSKIYESANSLIYQGGRELDLQPLVFKTLKTNYPTPDELTRYRQEYEITRSLDLQGVIKVYGIEAYQNTLVMFLEDFGGKSLRHWLAERSFSLTEILTLGIQLTESLGQVHQQQIIHKDINPSNIVWNPATRQLKLIDFGIASRITRETPTLRSPNVLEGTIAYMSPEQTGRMNRSIDYRTDFYSLGATLYELLTQQLPFNTDDALELVHCHLAKRPIAPCDRAPTIPQSVSDIVMKLLAKTAEDRYQSCRGIQVDLETCLTQLQATNYISLFPLAQQDSSDSFQIPQKLYGREREVERLLAAFETTECGTETHHSSPQPSSSKFMLISGYSGIGKTSLVQEIYKPITQQRGYFITGKFDQYQRDIPYSAFVSAFAAWVEQLLTETEAQLSQWRQTLLAALEPNASVLIEVIPELKLILGAQPPVLELPPSEAKNRFNRVLQQFIQVLAQPEHVLAVFLDDLQWVDLASLQLIQILMTTKVPCLFLIGAYRDNEVSATHPLMQTIDDLQKAGTTIEAIALSPLQKTDIQQLLADTLNHSAEEAASLADLVLAKTDGNPFFVNEFLRALYVEQLLTFDSQHNRWEWSIADIQQRNITDNVVELLVTKIQRLEQTTQHGLRRAACIGNQFDLQTLTFVLHSAAVLQKPDAVGAIALLKEAVNIGLIIPLNDSYKRMELGIPQPDDALQMEYKFAHDRIQQAAYSLNSAERPAIHWQIGQQILQHTPPEQREQRIFDIANQLNLGLGAEWITQPAREELVRLNLAAGQKAKTSAAYAAAMKYVTIALALLPSDSWHTQYNLTVALYSLAAEAAYLNGNLEQTEQFATTVLENAQTLLDKVKIYEVKIQAYSSQMQFLAALQIGLQTLEELDVVLPASPTEEEIRSAFAETDAMLSDRQVQELIHLPLMTDAIATLSLRILTHIIAPSYQAAPSLFPLLILKMVNLSIQHGNHELSTFAYAAYANILNCMVFDLDRSYQFVELALELLDQFHNPLIRCKTLFMANCSVRFCKIHVKETIDPLQEAYQLGIESGDIEFAGYSILHHCDHCFFVGMPLAKVERKIIGYTETLTQLKDLTNTNALRVYQQTILNLTQPTPKPTILIGEVYDEAHELPLLHQANHHKGLFYLYFNKLLLACYFQDADQAVANADQASRYPDGGRSNAVFPIFHFYDSLARLMQYPTASPAAQSAILQRVAENQAKMQLWAHHAPMNNLHRWYLIEAERHRVLGENAAAIANYDRAADLAREHDYVPEKALAHERIALFYLEQGKEIVARAYLQEARYCYLKWGATAKVKALEERYSTLFRQMGTTATHSTVSLTTTGTSRSEMLDLATVIKASQVLSGELNLEKLLAQLMSLVLQNAGAQTGTLLLEVNQHLRVEATGAIDPVEIVVQQSIPLEATEHLPISLIQYVARKQETVILEEAIREPRFANDRYIQAQQPQSVLCMPIQGQGKLIGILYLENNLTTNAFTLDRATILQVLTAQAAIALENTQLYEQLEAHSQTLEANNRKLRQEVSDRSRAEQQLRQSLAEREVLLKEIHHRVKNNLQIISGLLQLQAQSVTDASTTNILRESQYRIESMSLIHKKLYASSDFGEIDLSDYIPSLSSNLLASYQIIPGQVTLNMAIAPILLNIDQAIPCGLIINELVSNALKHAFPGDRHGEIHIHLHTPLDNQVALTIRDNGIGLPEIVDWGYAQSLGLSLVRDLVMEQLEGSLTVKRNQGTTFEIQFPQAPLLSARLVVKK